MDDLTCGVSGSTAAEMIAAINSNTRHRGFKNLLINGGFDIWQRGVSFGGSSYFQNYTADRNYVYLSSTDVVQKVNTASNGNYAQITHTLNETCILAYREEILDKGAYLSNREFTLSVGGINLNGKTNSATLYLNHAGGFVNILNISHIYGNSKTFTIPDLSGYTFDSNSFLEVRYATLTSLPTGAYGIESVQLEEGSVATPFEQRPIGLELSLCQRYYQSKQIQYSAYRPDANSPFSNSFTIVEKRVTPSITVGSYSNGSGGLTALTFLPNISEIIANASGSTSTGTTIGITADIKIDAEL